jgi:hypothetical protein
MSQCLYEIAIIDIDSKQWNDKTLFLKTVDMITNIKKEGVRFIDKFHSKHIYRGRANNILCRSKKK